MNPDTFHAQVYGQDTSDEPHGWIQWKGTNVCIDLHCKCGQHDHIDSEFLYFYRCSRCQTPYAVGQVVKLIELTEEQAAHVTENSEFHSSEEDRPIKALR